MTKKRVPAAKPSRSVVRVDGRFLRDTDEATDDAGLERLQNAVMARALTEPEVRAASVIQLYDGEQLDVNSLIDELRERSQAIQSGDMGRSEAMLLAQAHTLDALFCGLARKSHSNSSAGYFDAAKSYLQLALRAQAQAVRTIEALAELKNPKSVAFVKQANIANGHQQVNNYGRAGEVENEQIKQLDPGAQGLAGGCDTTLQAVGEVHGAKVTRG